MMLIESSVKKLEQGYDINSIYDQIELAGRTAYKSEDKIEIGPNGHSKTAEEFVSRMIKLGHGAVLEHGTVYLYVPKESPKYFDMLTRYSHDKYSVVRNITDLYITTNYRVIVENGWYGDLEFLSKHDKHEERITVKIVCDRAVSHELVRHRVFSFLQESQRYCNYTKDKFNNQITFVKPHWYDDATNEVKMYFNNTLSALEVTYDTLIHNGLKPQDARTVLPNSTKTELIMTGTKSQWEQFLKLRTAENAHPDMRIIAKKIEEIIK